MPKRPNPVPSHNPHKVWTDQTPITGYQAQGEMGPRMDLTSPGVLGHIKRNGPPPYGSLLGEEQEMAILGMLTMPEEFDPVPYSDQFSTERIYTKSIQQREQVSWQDQPEQKMNNVLATETFLASFRGVGSLWRRFLLHDPNKDSLENTMVLKDTENRASDQITLEDDDSGQLNFNIAEPGPGITYQPQGTTFVCGRTLSTKYANASWVWLDGVPNPTAGKGSKITVTFPAPAAAKCIFKVVRWNAGKYTDVPGGIPLNIGDTTAFVAILQSDYYSIFYEPITPLDVGDNFATAGVTITITSFCSVLRHIQVREAYKNMSQLGPGCTRAASLRLTDMAAPLTIQGESTVACTRENGTWFTMYSQGKGGTGSIFKSVVNYREAYLGPLRLGGACSFVSRTLLWWCNRSIPSY